MVVQIDGVFEACTKQRNEPENHIQLESSKGPHSPGKGRLDKYICWKNKLEGNLFLPQLQVEDINNNNLK